MSYSVSIRFSEVRHAFGLPKLKAVRRRNPTQRLPDICYHELDTSVAEKFSDFICGEGLSTRCKHTTIVAEKHISTTNSRDALNCERFRA
jgi:hypothetical protein